MAIEVYRHIDPGLLESFYTAELGREWERAGMSIPREAGIPAIDTLKRRPTISESSVMPSFHYGTACQGQGFLHVPRQVARTSRPLTMGKWHIPDAVLCGRRLSRFCPVLKTISLRIAKYSSPWPAVALRPPPCKKIPGLTPTAQANGETPASHRTTEPRARIIPIDRIPHLPFARKPANPSISPAQNSTVIPLQLPSNLNQHAGPVTGRRLAEQSRRPVPRAVGAPK